MSKGLAPKHQALSTYEKELLAIVMATQKWHSYLQGSLYHTNGPSKFKILDRAEVEHAIAAEVVG